MSHSPTFNILGGDDKYAEQGTAASGFSEGGPFHCGDCIHYDAGICYHPAVLADPELVDRRKDQGVKVGVDDCCRYVRTEE